MKTIELILIKPNLSNNICWVLEEPGDKEGFRELDRKTFIIPDGFEVAECNGRTLEFFTTSGNHIELGTNQVTRMPFLWDSDGKHYLTPVSDAEIGTLRDLRHAAGLSQREFADYFGIPLKTIQNWEIGRNSPADYLLRLMEYKLRREGIISGTSDETQP